MECDKISFRIVSCIGLFIFMILQLCADQFVPFYYGEEYSEDKASALAGMIEEKYPDIEVEVNYGGQPLYYIILSVE